MKRLVLAALTAVCAMGCGDSGGGGAAGAAGGAGAGGAGGAAGSGGALPTQNPLEAHKDDSGNTVVGAANYACNGHRDDGPGNPTEYTIDGDVKDFQNDYAIKQATVKLYKSIADVKADMPYDTVMGNDMGQFTGLKVPAMTPRVHFKVTAPTVGDQSPINTISLQFNPKPGTREKLQSVSGSTADTVAGIVGVPYDMTKGILAGSVRDCDTNLVKNAKIDVTINGAAFSDNRLYYFSATDPPLPVRHTAQYYTAANGLWAALNVDPGSAVAKASGVVATGMAQSLGEEEVPVFANTLTIVIINPKLQ